MKKIVLSLVVLAFMVVSCGPSAKELEEKRLADSIRIADSVSLAQSLEKSIADSIAKVDSIKKADSISKLPTKKVK
jgi:hypothetical protein